MKDLRNYVSTFNEAVNDDSVVINGKVVRKDSQEYKDYEAGKIGKDSVAALEPKTDNSVAKGIPQRELSKNEKKIKMRMLAKKPFFVLGHAGWGKSQIIKGLAKRMGYEINLVFLDKAVKEDLGGIPVPVKSGDISKQEMVMPGWAAKMYENPDTKYLLFFDEMNQADPQVMNALMPIVQDHEICGIEFKNFIVGAAGNYESENNAVNELSGPLKSRFKPLIVWDDNTPEAWKAAFAHLHEKLDEKFGKDIINKFQADCKLFDNPREIEQKVFEYMWDIWESGDYDDFTVDDYKDYLVGEDEEFEGLFKKDIARSDRDKEGRMLAQAMYDWIHRKEQKEAQKSSRGGGRRTTEMLDSDLVESMKRLIKNGYAIDDEDKSKKYGVCEENFLGGVGDRCVMSYNLCSKEQLDRIVKTMKEKNGGKDPWRFHKCEEYRAKGYLDPPVSTEEEEEE